MYRIGVVTGTRAEYGLLKPLLQKIKEDDLLDLYLIVTGAHLEQRFGYTCQEISQDGFHISQKIDMDLSSDSAKGICRSISKEIKGLAEAFDRSDMDLLILLGDRYETLVSALTAAMFNIPIAHIHGGETTKGAVDDAFRHAVTKMSHLHFASTQSYARRIIQMGEPPQTVFHVGAIGTENIRTIDFLTREELAEKYTNLFSADYMMVTYHPATLNEQPVQEQMNALFDVISEMPEYHYIFTYANADKGGAVINEMIDAFAAGHGNAAALKSMGQTGYLSALNNACAVIGNSSSGIIEAPSFHIPTVNIGDRQEGRAAGPSVIHCGNGYQEIRAAFQTAVSPAFRKKCREYHNPYEGTHTCDTILTEIKKALHKGICLQKEFYDIEV